MTTVTKIAATSALILSVAGGAMAMHPAMQPRMEAHIYADGKVNISGAKIAAISGDTITASASIGSFTVQWTVKTDGSTKLQGMHGKLNSVSDMKVGDYVSMRGTLDTTASTPTVNAAMVKDWSLNVHPILSKRIFEGKVQSVGPATLPSNFVLKVGNTNFTVNVPANISILGKLWTPIPFSSIQAEDHVRVYGAAQANNSTVIDAFVVRNVSK